VSRVQGLQGNCWPDPHDALLLQFLLHADSDAATRAWREWRPGWIPDAPTSEQYRLYPLMAERLSELRLDEPESGMLQGVRRQLTIRNMLTLDHLDALLNRLESAGHEAVALKGAALALTVYDHIGQRPFHDLDVLVGPRRFDDAVSLMGEDGWSRVGDYDPGLWDHAVTLRRGDVSLDLHRRHCRELVIPGRLDATWDVIDTVTARRPLRSGRSVRVLAPADSLVHALAHGTLALFPINLRWVADAQRVIVAGVDWDRVVTLAEVYEVTPLIRDGLAFVRDTTGTEVPGEVLRDLETIRPPFLARRRIKAFHEFRDTGSWVGRLSEDVDYYLEHTRHQRPTEVVGTAPLYAVRVIWPRVRGLGGKLVRQVIHRPAR